LFKKHLFFAEQPQHLAIASLNAAKLILKHWHNLMIKEFPGQSHF